VACHCNMAPYSEYRPTHCVACHCNMAPYSEYRPTHCVADHFNLIDLTADHPPLTHLK